MKTILWAVVLAVALTILPPLAFPGEFSEHASRSPQHGSGIEGRNNLRDTPSGLDGYVPGSVQDGLTQAEGEQAVIDEAKKGNVERMHTLDTGPDGKVYDFGPTFFDDGSDNQGQ